MGVISMKSLLEAGVHFGHQTSRWNPKMKTYIFGARNGIHIIDLQKTSKLFDQAYLFVRDVVSHGDKVLFVGTKKQAQTIVKEEAERSGMFYVNNRWLGGTLTNFRTIRQSVERLKTLKKMASDGSYDRLTKKEVLRLDRESAKLERNLPGIKDMVKLPGVLFVIDPKKEHIAIQEAKKLRIPVVGIADTNCNPEDLDFVIPANDDAIRAIKLFAEKVAEACLEGERHHQERLTSKTGDEKPAASTRSETRPAGGPRVEVVRPRRDVEAAAEVKGDEEGGGETPEQK